MIDLDNRTTGARVLHSAVPVPVRDAPLTVARVAALPGSDSRTALWMALR
jgi:hypothetical protein